METTEITPREAALRSPSRPPRRAARAWAGAVVCAAALAGTLVLHGTINHANKAAPKETVTTVNPMGHPVDGSIVLEDGSSEDPRSTRPPDSPSPTVSSPVDPNRSADEVIVNNSGGD